jgi:hypothetical protein
MGIYDWDLITNRIVWSAKQEQLWGFAPGDFDGTCDAFMSRVHPEDRPALVAQIAHCTAQHRRYCYELRVVWPDRSVH